MALTITAYSNTVPTDGRFELGVNAPGGSNGHWIPTASSSSGAHPVFILVVDAGVTGSVNFYGTGKPPDIPSLGSGSFATYDPVTRQIVVSAVRANPPPPLKPKS